MKDLDIENLERKNIYKTPDRFFEEMQAKVLSQAAPRENRRPPGARQRQRRAYLRPLRFPCHPTIGVIGFSTTPEASAERC